MRPAALLLGAMLLAAGSRPALAERQASFAARSVFAAANLGGLRRLDGHTSLTLRGGTCRMTVGTRSVPVLRIPRDTRAQVSDIRITRSQKGLRLDSARLTFDRPVSVQENGVKVVTDLIRMSGRPVPFKWRVGSRLNPRNINIKELRFAAERADPADPGRVRVGGSFTYRLGALDIPITVPMIEVSGGRLPRGLTRDLGRQLVQLVNGKMSCRMNATVSRGGTERRLSIEGSARVKGSRAGEIALRLGDARMSVKGLSHAGGAVSLSGSYEGKVVSRGPGGMSVRSGLDLNVKGLPLAKKTLRIRGSWTSRLREDREGLSVTTTGANLELHGATPRPLTLGGSSQLQVCPSLRRYDLSRSDWTVSGIPGLPGPARVQGGLRGLLGGADGRPALRVDTAEGGVRIQPRQGRALRWTGTNRFVLE